MLEPIGMADAAILDDPRPLGDNYAVGYTPDIFGDPSPLPFISLAGLAPAGSGWLRLGKLHGYGALPDHPDASRCYA